MSNLINNYDNLVFGLDIGTRSVVGSVGYMEHNKFNVVAHYVKEHETRAMMDGQIHDIQKVGETIGYVKHELEKQLNGQKLTNVCIAAAGRLLKTVTVHVEQERSETAAITNEDIYTLDSLGIEQAYEIIRQKNEELSFYCVGYTVVKYYMNNFVVNNLEGHKAKIIAADVLATFLPNDVVDGLYAAVSAANLEVASLTLEPIAAMNVAIPEQYRLLNIALVDVGAGTSDICITKDESIIAYGMIPHAGDEITENIVHQCLVEFKVAEEIKRASLFDEDITYLDIMGLPQTITAQGARALYEETVNHMTKEISDKIIELNGGKPVSAVFVVGGGGKVPDFTKKLASNLGIPEQRVALRGKEVLGDVNFLMEGVEKDPLLVTPIGICINFYNQKNNFIFVNINDIRIKLYDNNRLTVVDAAVQIGFPNEDLFPKRGQELIFTLNGTRKMIRGEAGEPALITINGTEADFHTKISSNDKIYIKESTCGAAASCRIEDLKEYKETLRFIVNGKEIICPKFATVNNIPELGSYEILLNDVIQIPQFYTAAQLMEFMDIDIPSHTILINGHIGQPEEPIYENFRIEISEGISNEEAEMFIAPESSDSLSTEETMEETTEETIDEPQKPVDLHVTVNQTPVTLKNKAHYTFVDIFEFYPFDTQTVAGNELVTQINGENCRFLDPVQEGDIIEIFWRTDHE
ncbi:MAG: cell division FtsA domain-containing protein [Lachnospiraceae bacterium]|nr:cell division FtsA domain-containing protein [Lachnospiraceae bacterium]